MVGLMTREGHLQRSVCPHFMGVYQVFPSYKLTSFKGGRISIALQEATVRSWCTYNFLLQVAGLLIPSQT